MMKKFFLMVAATLALSAQSSEMPSKDYYTGVAVNMAGTYGKNGEPDFLGRSANEFTNAGLTAIVGYQMISVPETKVFVEARIGKSIWFEGSEDISTTYMNLFVKPTYGDRIGAYALIGGSYVNWSNKLNIVEKRNFGSKAAPSIGVGVFAYVQDDAYLFIDYVHMHTDTYNEHLQSNVNINTVTVGLLYRF